MRLAFCHALFIILVLCVCLFLTLFCLRKVRQKICAYRPVFKAPPNVKHAEGMPDTEYDEAPPNGYEKYSHHLRIQSALCLSTSDVPDSQRENSYDKYMSIPTLLSFDERNNHSVGDNSSCMVITSDSETTFSSDNVTDH